MASAWYNYAKTAFTDGTISWKSGGSDFRLLLVKNTYTFDKDHHYVSDLTPASNELSGTGYSRKTLGTFTNTTDTTGDRTLMDCADVVFTAINAGTAAAAVIFVYNASDSAALLVAYIDSGGFPVTTNGGDLTIQWSSSPAGVLSLT